MTDIAENSKKKMASKRLASFEGLDEKDVTTLYNLAPIKRLKQGDALIREGDTDQTVYVILDGLITVIKDIEGQMEEIATLGEGDWVGEIAFTQKIKRTASAIAKTQVSVLVFEKRTIEALDPRIQLFFFRRLNDLAAVRVNELSVKESFLSLKNRQLVNYIQSVHDRTKTDYSHSDMILGILKKVPRLPAFAVRLALKTLDENFTPNELAEGIKDDPALVALILKIVNSPYYELANPVADIHHAIMLLGFYEIYQMVIADGARRTMPDGPFFRDLHFGAVAASHISFCLSQESLTGRPQEIATIGLMQRLGQGILHLLKEKNPNLIMLIEAMDHAQIGALLLKEWNMPGAVCQTVEYQVNPEFSPPEMIPENIRDNICVLFLTNLIVDSLLGKPIEELPVTYVDAYIAYLGWGGVSLTELIETRLLPRLAKKSSTFPARFRALIQEKLSGLEEKKE